jgi:hypothetical protein
MTCGILSTYDALHKLSSEASQIVRFVYFRSLPRAEQDLGPMKNKLGQLGDVGRGFYDSMRGVYTAAKEKDTSSFFIKLYRNSDPKDILLLSDKFKQEAYRMTTDDYERGFLIGWEIISKTLSELKTAYPEYPLKDIVTTPSNTGEAEEQSDFEVQPRKKPKAAQGKAD